MIYSFVQLTQVLDLVAVRHLMGSRVAPAVHLKPHVLGLLEKVHEAGSLDENFVQAVLVLLLQVDEVASAVAQVVDQLVLFVHYFVEDDVVVYPVDDLLIYSYQFRLNSFEIFPLNELLLFAEKLLAFFDEEFKFLEELLGLLLVEPLGNEIVGEHDAVVLVMC